MTSGLGEGMNRMAAGTPAGHCEPCGKFIYVSRTAARKARRRIAKGAQLSAYQCPYTEGWWHLGHLHDHEHGRDRLRAARNRAG